MPIYPSLFAGFFPSGARGKWWPFARWWRIIRSLTTLLPLLIANRIAPTGIVWLFVSWFLIFPVANCTQDISIVLYAPFALEYRMSFHLPPCVNNIAGITTLFLSST